MLPVKLKIQGVNSYIKEQIIDFEKLLDSKVFGIFGDVGSGKSTILEAMSYALYGKYDKLKGERVAYNLMNLKSSKFLIDFEFTGENNERYRFVVVGKRNSKRFDDVSVKRKYYKREKNEWLPVEKLDAALITGLSFENFNRTIIIPQGKFMEFINLSGKERTKMLKEIFNLHKYDLLDKVYALEKDNEKELANIEGRLTSLLYVNKDIIAANEKALEKVLYDMKGKSESLKTKEKKFKTLEKLKSDFLQLKNLEKEYALLSEKKKIIDAQKKQIREYEVCLLEFKTDVEISGELKENIERLNLNLKKEKSILQLLKEQLQETENSLEKISEEYSNIDNLRKQYNEYDVILQLKDGKQKLSGIMRQAEQLRKSTNGLNMEETAVKKEISILKKDIATVERNIPDVEQLAEINNWFSQADMFNKMGVKAINTITDKRLELKRLKNNVAGIFNSDFVKKEISDIEDRSPADLILLLESLLKRHKEILKQLQNKKSDLVIKVKLKEFASSLEDGKPCPVCGSTHHPDPIKPGNVDKELKEIENLIIAEESLIDEITGYLEQLRHIEQKIQNLSDIIEEEEKKYRLLKDDIEAHWNRFIWKNYSPERPEEIAAAFEKSKKQKTKLTGLRKRLQDQDKKLEDIRKKQDDLKSNLAISENRIATISGAINTLEKQLSIMNFNDFERLSIEEIRKLQETLKEKISGLEKQFTELKRNYEELKIKKEKQKTNLDNIDKNIKNTTAKLDEIEKRIDIKLKKSGYSGVDDVKKILAQNLDIVSIRREIEKFQVKLQSTENALQKLRQVLEDKVFDESLYEQTKNEMEKLKNEYELLIEEKSKLEDLILRQEKDLLEKEKLLKEKEKRELRASDLKIMRSLFTGSGFVNFISTVRLEEVVNYANSRFTKLTRGRLRLQLNRDNSFDVIDFLNDGKRRSIKTLSGGQGFQASLSLALALASIVQQQNKTKQNFFFLDEGFGTQDEDSLRLVFDAIKSLRKENRLVGLISHVAGLKEEVSTYLEVVYDEEGSKILKSWEK